MAAKQAAATGNTQVDLPKDTQEAFITYCRRAMELMHNHYSLRNGLQLVDQYYMMEGNMGEDEFKARLANVLGDKSKFRDVTVPVVMPQVESALGYYANVFLTGNPIFPVGSSPQNEDAALQVNSIFGQQEKKAKWGRQLLMFWRDGLKYNLHGLEVDWRQTKSFALETATENSAKPTEVLWAGNYLQRMDLYNTFFDPRVAPSEIHELGEFAGYNKLLSRVAMKKWMNELYGKISPATAISALESGYVGVNAGTTYLNYYIPNLNPNALRSNQNGQFDWMSWMQASNFGRAGVAYQNMYQVTKLYARIIPSDFNLKVPAANTPQVWLIWIVNNQVVVYVERLTNAHNYLPMVFGQPIEDGLMYQTKSFAQNVMGLQDTASALWNATMASKRKAINDRMLYDPSRVRAADINNPNPASKIPVRPSAYGKGLNDAVFPIPYRDDVSQVFVQEASLLSNFADKINGQNAAQQGQFTKGNRTLHEYQDIMGHSNTRNQLLTMTTDMQVHTPIKEMLLLNVLQFQTATTVMDINDKNPLKVDPVMLRQAFLEFEVADGLEPLDKEMNTEELIAAFQLISSTPGLQQGYRLAPMFTYLMQLRGADVKEFEKTPIELQYDQQLATWQQAAQQAAMKGAPFNSPMPQPPTQQQIDQQLQQSQQAQKQSIAQVVTGVMTDAAGPAASSSDTGVQSQIPQQ